MKRWIPWLALAVACASLMAHATPVDAPELARAGPAGVGVMQLTLDIGTVPSPQGQPPTVRTIKGWLWYPSAASNGTMRELAREVEAHPWRPLPRSPLRVAVPSVAEPEAPLQPGGRLPVVVLSHGLLNWGTAWTYLAEHLASRGYAVLAVEHDDERWANPLAAALLLRPLDQAGALRTLQRLDATPGHRFFERLALGRVALVGYSMGGYGALVSAGARVTGDGMGFKYVPGGAMARHVQPMQPEDAEARSRIAAVVALAPWGGQQAMATLRPQGLAAVRVPTLFLVGDQDDVSGYADGVRSLWEGLSATPRWLLVYENARHNIALHGAPSEMQTSFAGWSSLEEPVWRRDRLLDINRHFITAFLDITIRAMADRAPYLNPVVPRASDGNWPEPPGSPVSGGFAGAVTSEVTHWTGFQRRWAVGLRLERRDVPTASP